MSQISKYLKTSSQHLSAREAIQSPPDILLGVTKEASRTLRSLEISTVFDLALSNLFRNANRLVNRQLVDIPTSAKMDYAPADMLDKFAEAIDIALIASKDIEVLAGIGKELGPEIRKNLDVNKVRDLALWPPFIAAQAIVDVIYGISGTTLSDPEAPADLIPASGIYPAEKVLYNTIFLDDFSDKHTPQCELRKCIDVTKSIDPEELCMGPREGAVVTYSQSWYTEGVTLGQLLHSVALAPGESTKIAIIDWSRHSRTNVTESIDQSEELNNSFVRNRAISEVIQSVRRDASRGFQSTTADSDSQSEGSAETGINLPLGLGVFGGFGGLGLGFRSTQEHLARSLGWSLGDVTDAVSGAVSSGINQTVGRLFRPSIGSETASNNRTTTRATTHTSSKNISELSSTMLNRLSDSTHQSALSTRSRRATIVKESFQAEHETVQTRVITNYNHMHAMTIQYYEVVQLYKTIMKVENVEKVLFIPMSPIRFIENSAVLDQFRDVLARVALLPWVRDALLALPNTTTIQASSAINLEPTALGNDSWNLDNLNQLKKLFKSSVLDRFGSITIPKGNIVVNEINFHTNDGAPSVGYSLYLNDGSVVSGVTPSTNLQMQLENITSIRVSRPQVTQDTPNEPTQLQARLRIKFSYTNSTNATLPGEIDVPVYFPIKTNEVSAVNVITSVDDSRNLEQHLHSCTMFYSQAIWRSIEPSRLSMLLSKHSYRGEPLMSWIDPTPIGISGNFLLFRMSVCNDEIETWKCKHKVDMNEIKEAVVPLPTGGVFAEAVLGRFNCAEKLDITRFWNWQDSPIPVQAPDIQPIKTGSRARDDGDVKPGEMGQPVINIMNPAAAPEPVSTAAVLASLQRGNGADAAGLAGTLALAQAALIASSNAANQAGTQAGTNLNTMTQAIVEVIKTVAPIIGSAAGGGPTPAGAAPVSKAGALLNYGAALDRKRMDISHGAASGPFLGGNQSVGEQNSGNEGFEAAAFQSILNGTSSQTTILNALLDLLKLSGSSHESKPILSLGQKVPDILESQAVGQFTHVIHRGSNEFKDFEYNQNPLIVFKDEERNQSDHYMTKRMAHRMNRLAGLVAVEWPGIKLLVIDAWSDPVVQPPHNRLHYEGRAADLALSDLDSSKLGRLGQLAVDAGFDWVHYEAQDHIHVAVKVVQHVMRADEHDVTLNKADEPIYSS